MLRFIDRQHVDTFFKTGEIRLSSFTRFSGHKDEQRRDSEGRNIILGRGPNSTIYAVVEHGMDAWVLCGAGARDPSLFRKFDADAAIQVFNTTGFGYAIAAKIPGLKAALEGYCYYTDHAIEAKVDDSLLEKVKVGAISMTQMAAELNEIGGATVFFRKRLKFRRQHEYRWIWLTKERVDDTLTIQVPEARQYCLPAYRHEIAPSWIARISNWRRAL